LNLRRAASGQWAIQDSRGRIGAGPSLFDSEAECKKAKLRALAAAKVSSAGYRRVK
jgi:hypothetical protein